MASNILLFDGACGRCSNLASRVTAVSEGKLEAVSLSDPRAAQWALEAGTQLPDRPALVVLSEADVELLTGLRMVSRLLRVLGPRRSAAVLRAIGEDRTVASDGRRTFLRTGLIGLGVLAGAAVLPGVAQAQPEPPDFTAEETMAALRQAGSYNRMDVVQARLREHGFRRSPENEIVAGTREDPVVLSFYMRQDGDPTHAAVLARRVTDGEAIGALELFTANPAALLEGDRLHLNQLQHTPISLSRPGEVQPLSPAAYFSCMIACLGTQCGTQIAACRLIPNLPAMLLCIATFCNGPVSACHDECSELW